jgi:hypothetical protein
MKINKYEHFLLESVVNELILEANITFKKDFIEVLDDMKTGFFGPVDKICDVLLDMIGTDIDINQNNIGLSTETDKVTFIPEDKLDQANIKIIKNVVSNSPDKSLHPIQVEAKLPLEGMIFTEVENFLENDIINNWKIVKTIDMTIIPNSDYNDCILYYLQNTDDPTKFTTIFQYSNKPNDIPFEYILPENKMGKIKIGRYVNRLLDLEFKGDQRKEYTASDVEQFTNKFVSTVEYKLKALDYFRIISGGEIKHWYLSDNYAGQTGQLGQSCMRYSHCQEYFDIYLDNPEVCQLVIFTDPKDKLLGRALLWTLEDGNLYMDRIYTTRDSNIELFCKWGTLNGYKKQYPNSNYLKVKITPKSYELYPYMDTFKYYKPEEGLLSNKMLEIPYLELQEHNGQAERRI